MQTRREFLQVAAALAGTVGMAGGLAGCGGISRASATQSVTQDDLLSFEETGNVTLLHLTDLHAQLMPVYFREPSINIGVGEVASLPPHITGKALLNKYGVAPGSVEAYAISNADFTSLARTYGRVGGLDRMMTLTESIKASRPDNTLLLDGGDTWQGSYTSLETGGQDMVDTMNLLGVDAMTAHWEFTYGQDRVSELVEKLNFPFLAGNVRDTEWEEEVFESTAYFDRGGVKVAVIGQAFPYTPIANPRYMVPDWSFGIREDAVRKSVEEARANGAALVVLLSHNGFDVDRKLASRVEGIDVILSGHTHDALPDVVKVGGALIVASGSHGKFLSRLDLDVDPNGGIKDYKYKLIPVMSDVITPHPEMAELIQQIRGPHQSELTRVLGQTDDLLYRRGNFNGTFDDLICQALIQERDAEIALSPGFRWGATLLPGQDITVDDVYNMTAITYPNVYRNMMTGENLKVVLEDVADNLFNHDPYFQQGGDMVRVGGIGYQINPNAAMGNRISDITMLKTGEKLDASREYAVAGWASVNEGTEGPPVFDLVSDYVQKEKTVSVDQTERVKVVGI